MRERRWQLARRALTVGARTLVMGIINLTPDSFSEAGARLTTERACLEAERMLEAGADIIDIGGESTRPGAGPVSAAEEIERLGGFLDAFVRRHGQVPCSVDTTKAEVARVALGAGVEIVNDISGLRFDPSLADVVAARGAGLVLMHSRGTFETMHRQEPVAEILEEVAAGWRRSVAEAERRGVARAQLVLDPGIGFSKTQPQNVELIARLDELARAFPDFPLLVGTSRKSFIGQLLGGAPADERVHGTMATVAAAVLGGASIVRVHDVRAAVETVRVADAIKSAALRPEAAD